MTGGDRQCNANGQPADATCTRFEITNCLGFTGGAIPKLPGFYSFAPALTSTVNGMVVFFSGGGGNYYWGNHEEVPGGGFSTAPPDFVAKLRSTYGYDVVQVRWVGAWEDAAMGQDAGASRVACRPATLVKHIRQTLYRGPANLAVGRCGFCLVGSSGGSSQAAYAVTHYGLGSWTSGGASYDVDGIITTGGPTHAAMAKGCAPNRAETGYRLDGQSAKQIDAPMGYTSVSSTSPWYFKNGPCRLQDATKIPRWDQESNDTGPNPYSFPGVRFHLIVGLNDTVMRLHGNDFATRLWLDGTRMASFEIVPGMGHGVTESPAGMAALEKAIVPPAGNVLEGCSNGLDDDDDGAVDSGDGGCADTTPWNEISPLGVACDNGIDDDGDGRPDFGPRDADPGCTASTDTSEREAGMACDDGLDNNGTGGVDFPADLECSSSLDSTEGIPSTFFGLTVGLAGTGSGTVTSADGAISCPGACSAQFPEGSLVRLTASAAQFSTFSGWSAECDSPNNIECTMTMDKVEQVTATFTGLDTTKLTVTPPAADTGTVTSDPAGISCPDDCDETYLKSEAKSVTLTANPALGFAFGSWSGACEGQATPTCALTMDADRSVGVTFNQVETFLLTVTPPGGNQGDIRAASVGIDCPTVDCDAHVNQGWTVALTATPRTGWSFSGWTGSDCAGVTEPTCNVTMDQAKTVGATFASATTHQLTVTNSTPADGTVTSAPAGIDCGTASCSASFNAGQQVTLTAAPATGKVFISWAGACSGAATTCTVLMDQDRSVTATFLPGRVVTVTDYKFTPKNSVGLAMDDTIRWEFQGPSPHSVVDNKDLGNNGTTKVPLYTTGQPRPAGDVFTHRFCAAGSYGYFSPNEPQVMTGTVQVMMTASQTTGAISQPITIRAACASMPGFSFLVQQRIKPTGATKWQPWKTWQSGPNPTATFSATATGTYQFRTQLKNDATSVLSGVSPFVVITIS